MAVQELRNGKHIVGTMVRLVENPAIAQIAKHAGLDFIMCDMEHGTFSFPEFSNIAKVARSVGLGIFVRVPELAKGYVSRIMDAGADGVMVPMLSTAEEARRLVDWARYIPLGKRGYGTAGVHTSYGPTGSDALAFMKKQNELTLAIAQIETKEAIENIEAIAAVEGIDVLLVGPNDLSISLGVPGDLEGKTVHEAITKVRDAARKNGKVFSLHAGDSLLQKWAGPDMQMVMNNLDISVLASGFSAIAKKYKTAPVA